LRVLPGTQHGRRTCPFDSAGNLYIADNGNGRIRVIDKRGVITTFFDGR
jgi:hypothetical protein